MISTSTFYLSVLKNTSKEDLELLRLLINSGALLCKTIMHVAGSRSSYLCNTLQSLIVVALVIFGLDYSLIYCWAVIPSVVLVVYIVVKIY